MIQLDNYKAAKRRRRRILKIETKKLPGTVVAAFITGVLSFAVFIAMCIISTINLGKAGQIVGIVPIVSLVFNACAFFVSYRNLKREDVKKGLVSAAAFINGGMVIIYLVLYLVGFYIIFK